MAAAYEGDQILPEWKVYFFGGFMGHHERDRAGREIALNFRFTWDEESWLVPALYACGKGLVADFCVRVPAERIRAFMDQWNLSALIDRRDFTDEQLLQLDAENPLAVRASPKAVLNGKALPGYHSWGVSWNPCFPEGLSLEAGRAIRHYGLDPACGWIILRASFPWATKHRPRLRTLNVTLSQEPVPVPGPHFHVSAPGERIKFIYPSTGVPHTLTVQDYTPREMSNEHFSDAYPFQEFPAHHILMTYTLSPNLPDGVFAVTDCVRSELPRRKQTGSAASNASAVCIGAGIIGVADGPTALVVGGGGQNKIHAACSALRFEPADDVEWRLVFYEKKRGDVTVTLI